MTQLTERQIDELATEGTMLSEAMNTIIRSFASTQMLRGTPIEHVIGATAGALIYSFAECCARFVVPDDLESYADNFRDELLKIARDLQQGEPLQ